ncbi:MAG: hypothetical protein R3F59_32100 [Myxococcota bacterium]
MLLRVGRVTELGVDLHQHLLDLGVERVDGDSLDELLLRTVEVALLQQHLPERVLRESANSG